MFCPTLSKFLDSLADHRPEEIILRRALNETWFSDTLAWLLDPKGSHGMGVRFLRGFLARIAQRRGAGLPDGVAYDHRSAYLKFGKDKRGGTLASSLKLANAAVLREFYLSGGIGRRASRGTYCDLVIADLDTQDGLFVVIENKLFTRNHKGQLAHYNTTVEQRYDRVKVREYVYLTLDGSEPDLQDDEDRRHHKSWVRLSWLGDILGTLEETTNGSEPNEAIEQLLRLLRWLRDMVVSGATGEGIQLEVEELAQRVLLASAQCLHEELSRLDGRKDGTSWGASPTEVKRQVIRLHHSKTPSQHLCVQLLPSYSVVLQTRAKSGKAKYEKILVPFGAHPDQVFNLLDIAARDIYHATFAMPSSALGSKRRLRATKTPLKAEHRNLFAFLYKRRFELRVLFGVSTVVALEEAAS